MTFRKLPLAVLFAAFVFAPLANAAPLTGRQIVDKVSEYHEAPLEFELQTMTLMTGDKVEETRETRRYALKEGENRWKYLIAFLAPAGVKGVGLLTWSKPGDDDDQWLYLPALGDKLKRIAKGSQKDYFMGTDFTFEDLMFEDKNDFQYALKGDETIDGQAHYVVETVPANEKIKKESGYSKRVLFVRKDIFFVMRTDYYDRNDRLLKRQTVTDVTKVKGNLWRAQKALMDNVAKKHKTAVVVTQRSFDAGAVPAAAFTHRFILGGNHTR